MKKINLIEWLSRNSHEKQTPQRFARYAAILIMLLTLGVGQMWAANTYKITGSFNGTSKWGTWSDMTVSSDGFYEYYEVIGNNQVKINTSATYTNAINEDNKQSSFNGTNITNTWSGGDDKNICFYDASTFYILIYYANTCINTASSPKVCASSTLPNGPLYLVGDEWIGSWGTTGAGNMTKSGSVWTKTVSSVTKEDHTMKVSNYNWGSSWGGAAYESTSTANVYSYSTDGSGNLVFQPVMAGDVTVTFDPSEKTIHLTCAAPTITLNDEGGSGGSGTQNTYYGESPANVSVPTKTGYNFAGYYTAASGGTQIINASGAWLANKSGYTSSATKWEVRADAELHAQWTEKTYNVTVASNNYSYGTIMSGQTTNQTVSAKHFTSDCSITAEAKTGYRFTGWTASSGSVVIADATAVSTTIKATATGQTVTANFEAIPAGQLDIVAGANGQVKKESGSWGSSASYTDIISAGSYNIYAQANAGYHFVNWTNSGAGSITTNAASGVYSMTANGTATVTANFAEDLRTLTPTVSYDHGSSTYTATSSNTLGVATSTTLTASTPNAAHYTFAGWTLTNLTVTDGDASTDRSITVKITTPGSPIAAVAKYEEVLTSRWHLVGENVTSKVTYPDGWNVTNTSMMQKATGHSTESVVYANVTVSNASDTYEFKVVDDNGASTDIWYGYSNGETYLTWTATATNNVYAKDEGGENNNSNNLKFTPTVAGTYVFKVDYSGTYPAVTITYPTSYQVNYEVGTVKGASDDPSAEDNESNAISDGDLVLSGTEVTFTAADAADGYTWAGWYDAATTAGTKLSVGTARTYTTTISAATTVYAVYTENLYTVTVSAGDHGSISVPAGGTVSAGADTKPTITASPSTNYAFKWWSNTDGNVTATDWNSASTTVSATAAGTITANFFPQWALAGGDWNNTADDSDALGDWDTWTNGFEGFGTNASSEDTCIVSVTLPANTDFKFKIVDHRTGDWYGNSTSGVFKMTYADNNGKYWEGHVNSGSDEYQEFGLATAGAGSYKFAWNKTDKKAAVFFPTSYKVTFGYGTGGASVSASVSGSGAGAIANNQYAASGSNITFSESHSNGYTFKGWYDAASGGSAVATMGKEDHILNSIAADANVYAQYTENMTTVTLANNGHGHIEIGGETVTSTTAGVATTRTITAVPDAGYYFSGWTITEGTDFHLNGYAEANATATLTGNGDGETTGQTLTANFVELDKIYFRNIFDDGEGNVTRWESVYVHFDITWTEHDGKQAVQTSSDNISKGLHCSMTKIGTSDVYWAYVPRYITTNSKTSVAFADHDDSYNNSKLWEGNAAGRGDYHPLLNMFVPHHTKLYSTNSVDYYSNGYWMKYDTKASQGAGYYLKKYKSKNNYWQPGEFIATNDDATFIQFRMRVDNISADSTRFMIVSAGGLNYLAASTPTSISYSDIDLNEDTRTLADNTVYFQLTATSEGDYTFIIDQSGDKMKLTVDYPVSPGDYRIRHSYTDGGGTKYSYTDIIKKGTTSDKVSMYIRNTSGTLKIAKCSGLDANKKPVWTTGIDVTGYNAVNFPSAGVYVFDVAIVDNNFADPTKELTSATISNAAPYTGDYYIKTDCAPGGWVNYKQNVLGKNTINASDFDYYFCKNVANQTNVKFVIANDYNIQVTDTIIQDLTYLTTSGDGTSKEYMPESSCIRFSYNSATNEAKRAYLRYSSNNNFLNIIPSAASTVYDAESAGNDLYNSGNVNANNKFGNDDGNFVYRKTVYALSGATIDVKAEYNSNTQTFVSNKTLITSNQASTRYPVRVVYDFKTNHLTMAWEASTGLTDKLSNTEFLYIRNGQNAADEVSLEDGGEVNNSKVCGVFQFDYNDYVGKVGAWPQQADQTAGYTYSKCMFYFSFPFDVNVSDIFGLGTYGKEWKLQYYDGAERAKKGFFRGDGTTTFWKDVPADSVLTKNVGYSLLLDNDYFNTTADGMVFEGKSAGGSVYLYFPSANAITLGQGATSIDVPSHKCTLSHSWTEGDNTLYHSNTDSHWNMMGVPLFQSQTGNFSGTFKAVYDAENPFGYLYAWDPSENSLNIANASDFTFKSMNAYMVQYTGTVNFSGSNVASIVAAPQRKEEQNYTIDLAVLNSNDEHINRTYVELREGASDDFELNEDVYMTLNSKNVNIYSYAGDYDVAANVLSVANHTVPVGVTVKANGTYKFSMLSNFSGTVTLVDKFAQTRTNLAIEDYEVTLNKGTINDRFELEININKTPTAIDGVESGEGTLKDGKAHKFIMNDMLYIIRDGRIYDATGVLVK